MARWRLCPFYSSVAKQLEAYGLPAHRKAVMLEVLRVLATGRGRVASAIHTQAGCLNLPPDIDHRISGRGSLRYSPVIRIGRDGPRRYPRTLDGADKEPRSECNG